MTSAAPHKRLTATSLEAFQHEILRNWATHFGCSPATVQQAGITLLPADKYAGQRLIALWHIGAHTFVEHDPAYTQVLERVVAGLPAGAALTGDTLKQSWGADMIAAHDLGLAHYLYPPDLPPYTPPAPFVLRRLTPTDAAAMAALHAANSPEDVDEGYVEVSHEIAFGCFAGDQLVAAASGYRRTGFMDIGVLTHPEFRRQGLGKATVGALCAWSSQQGLIAQYRCNTTNVSSQGVALALNFRLFFQSESVWLAG